MTRKSEGAVMDRVRIEATRRLWRLYRNNVGAVIDSRGVPVRFGLANDSSAANAVVKSADLIGWRSLTITPDMVGKTFAQFVSVECKGEGARTDPKRLAAQQAWANLVNTGGGYAVIIDDAAAL